SASRARAAAPVAASTFRRASPRYASCSRPSKASASPKKTAPRPPRDYRSVVGRSRETLPRDVAALPSKARPFWDGLSVLGSLGARRDQLLVGGGRQELPEVPRLREEAPLGARERVVHPARHHARDDHGRDRGDGERECRRAL